MQRLKGNTMKTLLITALALSAPLAMAEQMDHSTMDHSEMDHSKMDHSGMMNMPGMSEVGMPAKGAKPDKVVHVILSDDNTITFKKPVTIEPNDVVQFVVMNTGSQIHEFSIGSTDELKKHRAMMKQMAGMEHDTNSSIVVEPKKARQFLWHFHGKNHVEIACNISDHYEKGMVKKLTL